MGIFTRSGREITPTSGVPMLEDIAVALSRIPRFAGHTRELWTVADHSLFCELLARDTLAHLNQHERFLVQLAALLHDAHEAITSDVPTHFKPDALRRTQHQIDQRIMDEYFPGGYNTYLAFAEEITKLDRRALLAEAVSLHPALTLANIERYFGGKPEAADVALLTDFTRSRPPGYAVSGQSRLEFAARYRELVSAITY